MIDRRSFAFLILAACTSGAPPPQEPEPVPEKPTPTSPTPVAAPTRAASPAASVPSGERPVPPLSTPNARPTTTAADGGSAPPQEGVPHVDPQQIALRRAGEAAQACYDQAKLPRGTAGKLHVRIALAADGSVERAETVAAQSSAKLLGGKLESCVLDTFKKQSFPPPRAGAEVVLDVPLEFSPVK